MSVTYRLGIIGLGNRSCSLIRAASECGRFTIVAGSHGHAVERPERPVPLPESATYHTDWQEVLASHTDAVVIATPNDTHADIVRAAIAHGVHILCEKPLTHSIDETREIWRAVQRATTVFHVGMELRYAPAVQSLVCALEDGTLEQPQLVWAQEFRPPFRPGVREWRRSAKRTGGTFLEKNCHHFDLFALVFGDRPVSVHAMGAPFSTIPGVVDQAMVLVRFLAGGSATLALDMTQATQRLRLGALGRGWSFDYNSLTDTAEFQPQLPVPAPPEQRWQDEGWDHPGEVQQFQAFARRIDGEADSTADRVSPLWAHVIACAAETSLASGRVVRIDEAGHLS